MDELGVSRATLKRDLEYLRERLDAPIVYDRFANGYSMRPDARDQRQVRHELPGVWFSEREIHALLTMHQLIQGLDEDGVLARHLQPLLDKLHGMLGASDAEAGELMKRVKIMSAARRPVVAPALRADRQRADAAPARADALLRAQPARGDRTQRVAAAAGPLAQHLVPRCLVPLPATRCGASRSTRSAAPRCSSSARRTWR